MTSLTPEDRLIKAFEDAQIECNQAAKRNVLTEDLLTGGLLRSLQSSLRNTEPDAIEDGKHHRFAWSVFNQGQATSLTSEAAVGADFGLLLINDTGRLHFAMFQAKRPTTGSSNRFSPNHTREDKKTNSDISQLLTLHRSAEQLMQSLGKKSGVLGQFGCVHYLCYMDPTCCVPLSKLGVQMAQETVEAGSSQPFSSALGTSLEATLVAGLKIRTGKWLHIKKKTDLALLPQFFPQMPLIVLFDLRYNMELAPNDWLASAMRGPEPRQRKRPGSKV